MNRTWFITGAARGIGAEIVKAALAAGDNVVATGRSRARIEQAFGQTDRLLALELDVTNEAQAQAAAEAAVARFGRIDLLVNNAGYGLLGPFEEIEAGEIEQQFATNVFGTLHVTRAVLPVMRRQRAGHIFNLSSVGGMAGFQGASIYCASKFAVEGFSESLALEVAQFGIRVTIVEPGYIRTDFLDDRSVRYGNRPVEDYARSSAEWHAGYDAQSHRQAGDPAKLAASLLTLAATDNPPLRYVAGSDAFGLLGKTHAARLGELEAWRSLSVSSDFAA